MAKHDLVIVESPAKAKTIGKYLGKDYEVKACMGHLRDLQKSNLSVDVDNDFEPVYKPIKGKEAIISDLKKSAKAADTVYLATDPDREGEAISWHLKSLLNLPDDKTKRVTFNEITKNVVRQSIESPRDIDQNLVDAQQARRILDRLVGYQLSPLLWKKIKRGLSAGRVQSVATRMVDDRDREIENFKPEEYWTLDANLTGDNDVKKLPFSARYHGKNGKKAELKSAAQVEEVVEETKNAAFTVKSVKRTDKNRSPSPPFTTSTMQQEASRKLSMTPRRTMAIAQQLYEGVDIEGEGTVGLITYMRTDSLRISEEAIAAAKNFIVGRYGQQYYPARGANHYKAKANAQDAHEAIRPSNVNWTPEDLKRELFSSHEMAGGRGWFGVCTENHDQPRSIDHYLPREGRNYYGATMLASMYLLLRGTPYVYQGQEIGMRNCAYASMDDYNDVSTHNQYNRALADGFSPEEALRLVQLESRDNARTPFQWDDTENAGFTTGKPWLKVNPNYTGLNAAQEERDEDSVLTWYKKMIGLRLHSQWSELISEGTFASAYREEKNLIAYRRRFEGKALLVLCNMQPEERELKLSAAYRQVIADNYKEAAFAGNTVCLRPYEVLIAEEA